MVMKMTATCPAVAAAGVVVIVVDDAGGRVGVVVVLVVPGQNGRVRLIVTRCGTHQSQFAGRYTARKDTKYKNSTITP